VSYLLKVTYFDLLHQYLTTPVTVTAVECRGDFWLQKTESLGYRVALFTLFYI